MKVDHKTNDRGIKEIHIVMTVDEAELTQAAVNQFAEKTAKE